jgi:hypothetical protein
MSIEKIPPGWELSGSRLVTIKGGGGGNFPKIWDL